MQKPNGSFVKKVFAAGLAVTTALWAMGGLLVVPVQADAVTAHPAGTLVVSAGTVWKISDAGTGRQGIDSLAKFNSNFFSFSNVVPANSADLALSDQGLLPWGSGQLFNSSGTVYLVSGGVKHGFTSAANFTGNGYKFSNVVAGDVSGLTAGANVDSTTAAHLEGSFVVNAGTVWMITATGKKGVSSPGVLYSYGRGFKDVVAANSADTALTDEGLLTFRTGALVNDSGTVYAVTATSKFGFPTASCFTGFGYSFASLVSGSTSGLAAGASLCSSDVVVPPTGGTGTLSVSLASDTPASTSVVNNAARVGFTKVNLTANGGDVVINQMVVQRVGISTDANISNIIILDVSNGTSIATAAQLGNEKTLNSNHQVAFNDAITVSSGTTKSLMFAGNMYSALNAADQVQLSLVSMTLGGTSTVSGTLPITGNTMTMNSSVVISTVTVAAGGSNPSATTQNVGTTAYILTSLKLTISSTEDVSLSHISFYNNGTAADGDVTNLKLMQNGSVIGTAAALVNKVISFNFATPIVIAKGNNQEFNLVGDLVSGSGRTVRFDIDKQADLVVKGNTYGFFILPTYSPARTSSPYFTASATTINYGGITFSKGILSSLNIASGQTSQAIGAFKTTVQGEQVQVTKLVAKLGFTGTGATYANVTNVVVKDSANKTVAGPVSAGSTTNSATSTDTIIFPVGTNTYTIYADLNSSVAANATIKVTLADPATLVTAKGVTTNQTITPGPAADLGLDTVTVKAGTLQVSTSTTPAAQTVIVGASGLTFANFVLDASASGEDVRVTQLNIAVHSTSAKQDNVANLTLYNGSAQLLPIVQPASVAAATATSTFSLTNPVVVTKGTSVTLTLKGDLIKGDAGNTIKYGLNGAASVTAVGASTASTVAASVTNSDGQTMTLATSGTLTIAGDSSEPTQGSLLTGGSSKVTIGSLLLTASQEDVNLDSIQFDVAGGTTGSLTSDVAMVYLFDDATQIASMTPTSTTAFTFTNLNGKFKVTKGSVGKKLTVKVDTASITNHNGDGNSAGSGDALTLSLAEDSYAAIGVSSGSALGTSNTSGTFSGQTYSLYKSVPTWQTVALPTSTLSNGINSLYKFKLTADSKGDIGFYKASFAISTTTATVTQFQLFEEPNTTNSVNLTTNSTRTVTTNGTAPAPLVNASDGKGGQYAVDILFDTGTSGVANGGEYRVIPAGTSKTFELRGYVSSSTTGSQVSVVERGDSAFVTSYPFCAGGAAAGNTCSGISDQEQGKFVWSDLAYGNNTSTATDTAEWTNGYLVVGMTTTSTQALLSR
ncbi:hypothetical protein D4R52_02410 [bacterium]|nr:MAG: hypothetical protein D4R52_02410 [bacterium]